MDTRGTVDYGVNGTGSIATIKFKTEDVGEEEIVLDNLILSDNQMNPVPLTSSYAEINIFRLVGDVNGDCKVNIFDLATVGLAYGSRPGDAYWKPEADTYPDGIINIFDLATVGMHYGEIC